MKGKDYIGVLEYLIINVKYHDVYISLSVYFCFEKNVLKRFH